MTIDELKANVIKLIETALDLAKLNLQKKMILYHYLVKRSGISLRVISWFDGEVISQVPGYPAWYNVVYEGDNSVYTYQLWEDLAAGDFNC